MAQDTEKDVQHFVKTLLKESDKQRRLMYGTNVKVLDRPNMRQHLISQLRDHNFTPDQLKISPKTLKYFDRGVGMGMAIAHYKHTTDGKVTFQEFALQNLESLFSLSPDSLLTNTKFRFYKKYFFDVIPSNIDKQKFHRINEFLKNINKKEIYALGQQMTQLNLRMRKLHMQRTPITVKVIDEHKEIYDLTCSCVEKYLKILYGVKMANEDTILDYNDVKKTGIYEIKRKLEKSDDNYRLLLKPFSTIIWNADKHTGRIKNLAKKRIEFIANEGVKWKTYSSFVQLTRELCSVTFLLSRYIYAIALKAIRPIDK